MAEVAAAENNLLTTKWGPMPVWLYALIVLVLAWIYAKWKASKSTAAAAADTTDTANLTTDDGQATAPQFIIENNMPAQYQPSAPITTPAAPAAPVVTPPATTPNPPISTPSPPPVLKVPAPVVKPISPIKKPVTPAAPAKKAPIAYKVVHGDTLSAIAAKYHTTAAKLFTYNTTPGVRPAATIATLKQRGPNLLFAGETIYIPQ